MTPRPRKTDEEIVAEAGPFEAGLYIGHGGGAYGFRLYSKNAPYGDNQEMGRIAEAIANVLNKMHHERKRGKAR